MAILVPSTSDTQKPTGYQPIVQELREWMSRDMERKLQFDQAIATAKAWKIAEMRHITTLEDYFNFLNEQLTWVPSETVECREILNRLCIFFFVMDQPSVMEYQSPVEPSDTETPLTWLTSWIKRFGQEIGSFLDTPESITEESLATFRACPKYCMDDYVVPRPGWRSFNDFFARHFKPGRRPIAAIGDSRIIVSPADQQFDCHFNVGADSTVAIKGVHWKISQLVAEHSHGVEMPATPSAGRRRWGERFGGGVWMHMYLGPSDYHRVHAPIGGTVLDARVLPGCSYLQVEARQLRDGPRMVAKFHLPNELGYHFIHTRGLIVLETALGLVAVIPVGMPHVSSVVVTAEVGAVVHKGEELAYFQFGGSDVVLLFEHRMEVIVTARPGEHYLMGQEIGYVEPEALQTGRTFGLEDVRTIGERGSTGGPHCPRPV